MQNNYSNSNFEANYSETNRFEKTNYRKFETHPFPTL